MGGWFLFLIVFLGTAGTAWAEGGYFGGLADGFSEGWASQPSYSLKCENPPPDIRDTLQKIEQYEKGIRALGLPKQQTDRLIRDGREVLVKNAEVTAKLKRLCTVVRRDPDPEVLRQQRTLNAIQRQNREMIDSQEKL